jgi:hypothetical protein
MPSVAPAPATPSSLVRKRGKLPKETTDYLKAWLHRHSDHPYPSDEGKKQLCNATGLSMSQVSNWMINVRLLLFFTAIQSIKPFSGSPPDFSSSSGTRTPHPCTISIPEGTEASGRASRKATTCCRARNRARAKGS